MPPCSKSARALVTDAGQRMATGILEFDRDGEALLRVNAPGDPSLSARGRVELEGETAWLDLVGQLGEDSVLVEGVEAITQDIATRVERYSVPGLAVAVIADWQVLYDRGFGYRNLATHAPVTPDTQFGIGSIVKSFTSGIIGSLQADVLLSLKANPAVFVPANPHSAASKGCPCRSPAGAAKSESRLLTNWRLLCSPG